MPSVYRILTAVLLGGGVVSMTLAAPLIPTINGHDFAFGAYNGTPEMEEYATNGAAADTLTFTADPTDSEVVAYWPAWPEPPVEPVFGEVGFGGDFVLDVDFISEDAPYIGPVGTLDVSLVGTGGNDAGPDLMIYGTIGAMGTPELLWAIELVDVALYGYADAPAYKLDGVGVIVGGTVAERNNLIGLPGAMRGDLDFFGAPDGWVPSLYDPATDVDYQIHAAYSGETGVAPEPASLLCLALGAFALIIRRF